MKSLLFIAQTAIAIAWVGVSLLIVDDMMTRVVGNRSSNLAIQAVLSLFVVWITITATSLIAIWLIDRAKR